MLRKLRGFTLIELVIVLAILAILAAVAIPKFVDLSKKARKATADSELGSLRAAAQLYYASLAVGGSPKFPLNKTVLRTRLDQDITQLSKTGSTTADFQWAYDGSATGVVRKISTGSAGWGW